MDQIGIFSNNNILLILNIIYICSISLFHIFNKIKQNYIPNLKIDIVNFNHRARIESKEEVTNILNQFIAIFIYTILFNISGRIHWTFIN